MGTFVNTATVLVGGSIGLLLHKGLPERVSDTLMKGLGLCTLFIGISGALAGENVIILIAAIVLGGLVGELLDLDGRINQMGLAIQHKCSKQNENSTIASGFVSASLLFCVGAMSILGPLESGISGVHTIQFAKAVLDGIAAIIFASQLGIGVLFSAGFVLLYQGSITLLAGWISPYLTDTVIHEMSCAGYVIIIGLALNMLGITKLKIMNYIPAIFIAMLIAIIL